MTSDIKRIVEELGANQIKNIFFDKEKDKWIITYKPKDFHNEEFNFFRDAINWIYEESNQE